MPPWPPAKCQCSRMQEMHHGSLDREAEGQAPDQLRPFLAMEPRSKHISLSLSFLICEMPKKKKKKVPSFTGLSRRANKIIQVKPPEQCLADSTCSSLMPPSPRFSRLQIWAWHEFQLLESWPLSYSKDNKKKSKMCQAVSLNEDLF